ncbi:hypothetical protein FCE86_028985 [Pseudomonas chlororaphis subsp. aureofaciens]|nr:hypothetical protein F7R16_10220 [Pseudomonas chlororaphis subsp. aureofaciens]TSD27145.1 hypothetical protein FCE86_028985 [Pseudomonas sp. ATCC 13985]
MKIIATYSHQPWNKGKLVGQKTPLRVRDIWAIRVRLAPANQGIADLSQDEEPESCATPAWSYEA